LVTSTQAALEEFGLSRRQRQGAPATMPEIVPALWDASRFLRCSPGRRKTAGRLVWERPVGYNRTAECPFLSLQPLGFTWKDGMAWLYIRELTAPVLQSLDCRRRQINQTAFAAFRLALPTVMMPSIKSTCCQRSKRSSCERNPVWMQHLGEFPRNLA
jgi:hypothetical protein